MTYAYAKREQKVALQKVERLQGWSLSHYIPIPHIYTILDHEIMYVRQDCLIFKVFPLKISYPLQQMQPPHDSEM